MTTIEISVPAGDQPVEVTAHVGDAVVLRTPENATTGYRWTHVLEGDHVQVVSSAREAGPSTAPGAGGERVVRVQAIRDGDGYVVLRLGRSWETTPVDERRVRIRVVASEG